MNRQALYDAIVKDVMAALECARNGERHGRLDQMMLRTIVKDTASMPPCPESVLPPERRRFTFDNPAPVSSTEVYRDFDDRREMLNGASRQE